MLDRIKELMKLEGIKTWYGLAKATGVGESTFRRAEDLGNKLSIDTLRKLLNYFKNWDARWIITGETRQKVSLPDMEDLINLQALAADLPEEAILVVEDHDNSTIIYQGDILKIRKVDEIRNTDMGIIVSPKIQPAGAALGHVHYFRNDNGDVANINITPYSVSSGKDYPLKPKDVTCTYKIELRITQHI